MRFLEFGFHLSRTKATIRCLLVNTLASRAYLT